MKTKKKRIRRPKHTLEQMQQLYKDKGCELLSTEYLGSRQWLTYRCSCGKIRRSPYNNWYRYWKCNCNKTQESFAEENEWIKVREESFNVYDIMNIFGINRISELVSAGILPKRSKRIDRRTKAYYTEDDVITISKILKDMI